MSKEIKEVNKLLLEIIHLNQEKIMHLNQEKITEMIKVVIIVVELNNNLEIQKQINLEEVILNQEDVLLIIIFLELLEQEVEKINKVVVIMYVKMKKVLQKVNQDMKNKIIMMKVNNKMKIQEEKTNKMKT